MARSWVRSQTIVWPSTSPTRNALAAGLARVVEVRHLGCRDALEPDGDVTDHDGVAVENVSAPSQALAGQRRDRR